MSKRHFAATLPAAEDQRITVLESHAFGHLRFQGTKCPFLRVAGDIRTEPPRIETQAFGETRSVGTLDGLTETFDRREYLLGEIVFEV